MDSKGQLRITFVIRNANEFDYLWQNYSLQVLLLYTIPVNVYTISLKRNKNSNAYALSNDFSIISSSLSIFKPTNK
jgi:hypothetical protein